MSHHFPERLYFSIADDRNVEIVVRTLLPRTHGIGSFVNCSLPHASFAAVIDFHSEPLSNLDDSSSFLRNNCHFVSVILPLPIDVPPTSFRHVHISSLMLGVHSVFVPILPARQPFLHYHLVLSPLV